MKLDTTIQKSSDALNICGVNNSNIKIIENIFNIEIELFGSDIFASTEDEEILNKLNTLFSYLLKVSNLGVQISNRDVIYINNLIEIKKEDSIIKLYEYKKPLVTLNNNKKVYPKTLKQIEYLKSLENKDLIFSVGPAGTGKTFLAVCHAVMLLKKGTIKKILLTRPAVEAGENLGFLPGDLKEKVDPYLRPLYDALYDNLGIDTTNQLIEKQVIEIAPLAYMRGRTLENAYIILDEAQNTTTRQMKMFLTRLGFNSKMVVTGDISQIDLPKGVKSGLTEVINILDDIKEISIITFDKIDIIRHPLVLKIIERYDKLDEINKNKSS